MCIGAPFSQFRDDFYHFCGYILPIGCFCAAILAGLMGNLIKKPTWCSNLQCSICTWNQLAFSLCLWNSSLRITPRLQKLLCILAISLLSPSLFEISTRSHPQSDFSSWVFTLWGLARCSAVPRRYPGPAYKPQPMHQPQPDPSSNPHLSLDLGSAPEPQQPPWLYHGTHKESHHQVEKIWHHSDITKKTGQGGC